MAIVASRPSAGTSASLLAQNTGYSEGSSDATAKRYLLKNLTAGAPVFLGDSGVTTGAGFQWDVTDGPLEITLEPGESLYGIATAAQTIHVLAAGR